MTGHVQKETPTDQPGQWFAMTWGSSASSFSFKVEASTVVFSALFLLGRRDNHCWLSSQAAASVLPPAARLWASHQCSRIGETSAGSWGSTSEVGALPSVDRLLPPQGKRRRGIFHPLTLCWVWASWGGNQATTSMVVWVARLPWTNQSPGSGDTVPWVFVPLGNTRALDAWTTPSPPLSESGSYRVSSWSYGSTLG